MKEDTKSKLEELAERFNKEVQSMAKPGEKWTVSASPAISITLYDPNNPESGSGRGKVVDADNCHDVKAIMDDLRSYWADRARKNEEYAKALLEKCGDSTL